MSALRILIFWFGVLAVIIFLTLAVNLLSPYGPNDMNLANVYAPPGDGHLFGTDHLGRDLFTRLFSGGQVTLALSVVSVLLSLVVGVVYGGLSGYAGGIIDTVLMRLLDAFLAIPSLLIILAFQVSMQGGIWTLALLIGLTNWFVVARIVRSDFLRLKDAEFVQMARMFGTPQLEILWHHMLRNSLPAVLVVSLFNFANAVFIEASLSFLGIGIPPEVPSWGSMLYDAQNSILTGAWWLGVFPGILLVLTLLALNYIGEALKVMEWGKPDA